MKHTCLEIFCGKMPFPKRVEKDYLIPQCTSSFPENLVFPSIDRDPSPLNLFHVNENRSRFDPCLI